MKKRKFMVVFLLIIIIISFANTTMFAKSCGDALVSCLFDAAKIAIVSVEAGVAYATFCASGYSFFYNINNNKRSNIMSGKKNISILLIIVLILGFSVLAPQLSYAKEKTCAEMFLDCMDDWFAPLAAIGAAYCAGGFVFCEKYMK